VGVSVHGFGNGEVARLNINSHDVCLSLSLRVSGSTLEQAVLQNKWNLPFEPMQRTGIKSSALNGEVKGGISMRKFYFAH